MKVNVLVAFLFGTVLFVFLWIYFATAFSTTTVLKKQLSLSFEPTTGNYSLCAATNWCFFGSLDQQVFDNANQIGTDRIGSYHETTFHLKNSRSAAIRIYDKQPLALFTMTYETPAPSPDTPPFPNFTSLPEKLHVLSYASEAHTAPVFSANNDCTPWLLFDDFSRAFVISAADHFFITRLEGTGVSHVRSQLHGELENIPAGFSQKTLVAMGQGINNTWEIWGNGLTNFQGKKRPANDADFGLKYLGYWTNNDAAYYYYYDKDKGYAGTLLALIADFRKRNIPVRYLQLDSWWYYKSFLDPAGQKGDAKNPNLPAGEWNRYGGLTLYRAHPDLFPEGLFAFHKKIGMPFITHNRWIDPTGHYGHLYKVSGIAGVDPRYWQEIASYLKSSGVLSYVQDWFSEISRHSPLLSKTVDLSDAFMDGMANAMQANGLTMQYSMAMPWNYLQGSRYSNLTTVRVSKDGFRREHWHDFLYTSRLASALGEWPWSDNCVSRETNDLLLSVLSAGMVGFGDEMGKENQNNLRKAVRADGVIVKPDAVIVPTDDSYIAEANGEDLLKRPLLASTYTDHDGLRTHYLFAFGENDINANLDAVKEFTFKDAKTIGKAYVYDYFANQVHPLATGSELSSILNKENVAFLVIAPVGPSGIAFFGDAEKFISTGKKRIVSIRNSENNRELMVDLLFASGESIIKLHGAGVRPLVKVKTSGGSSSPVVYDDNTTHWSVNIIFPADAHTPDSQDADGARKVTVLLTSQG